MSGHSHWATIKRKKEASDQERGRLFSKASREIMLAINQGGGTTDPEKNVRLRAALERAKELNVPKENIKRLIERVEQTRNSVEEVVYEALGPGGISYVIKTATDNPRRTHAELNTLVSKSGGKLVEKGSIVYLYDLCGMFVVENKKEDEVLRLAEAIQAVDLQEEGGIYILYVPYEQLSVAWLSAQDLGFSKTPELVYKPKTTITLEAATTQKALELAQKIEENDDVQDVYMNLD